MYKDYFKGRHETRNFELTDCGSSNFSIRLDGILDFIFDEDLALFSDTARLTPLSPADWEFYKTEAWATSNEATGGSGKTMYSQIRILNATYQTGTIYGTLENYGGFPSGNAQGVDVLVLTDASFTTNNYDFTIEPNVKNTIIDCSAVTAASQTITMVQGTHPSGNANPSNQVTVIGSDTVAIGVTWSGAAIDWNLSVKYKVGYSFHGADLNRGQGWEDVFGGSSAAIAASTIIGGVNTWDTFKAVASVYTASLVISEATNPRSTTFGSASYIYYDTSATSIKPSTGTIQKIWKWFE